MTPPFLLQLPEVASGIGLPLMGASQPPDPVTAIQQLAGLFASGAAVLSSLNLAVIDIVRVAYVACLLIGALLYFTRVGSRLGKERYFSSSSPSTRSARSQSRGRDVREVVSQKGDYPSEGRD